MKAVVLLSGGIDSTTCLAMAVTEYGAKHVAALCTDYGQKHDKEIQAAENVANYYGVPLTVLNLQSVFACCSNPLLKGGTDIKHESYASQLEALGGEGTVDTYVPFRNGLLLSCAASVALSMGASRIYYGAHADDAAGRAYPDCTESFVDYMSDAISSGTANGIMLVAPLIRMNKSAIVTIGLALGAPYHLTWSCYEGKEVPCGRCGTCIDRAVAFKDNGIVDPARRM